MKISRRIHFPDPLILLLGFLLVFILLTWILPAGSFDRVVEEGRTQVVPGTYQSGEGNPQGIAAFFTAPFKGFVGAADIIAFVVLIGGAFSVFTRTGAVEAGIRSLVIMAQQHPRRKVWILPLTILLFSLGGATFGMAEEVLVFVLLTIPMSRALGYDVITGVAISFVGAGVGFAGAFLNPFTVGIAQGIAELPPFSGIEYRLLVWVVFTGLGIGYIMRYARKIEGPPEVQASAETARITRSQQYVLILLVVVLAGLVFGVIQYGWYIQEISGIFTAMAVFAAILGGLKQKESIDAFLDGAKEMAAPALIIGLAKALIIVAEDGQIIDTLLFAVTQAVDGLPRTLSVEAMFLFQSGLNFFVPSGSGQAALTMPLMAPLSDLLTISRQTAVLAYQFGDGISNLIIPTSGITMGVLAIAKIPYQQWLRWMFPLFLLLSLAAALLLLPPVLGWIW